MIKIYMLTTGVETIKGMIKKEKKTYQFNVKKFFPDRCINPF